MGAQIFQKMSRVQIKQNDNSDVLTRAAENVNSHQNHFMLARNIGKPFQPRFWLTRNIWKKEDGRIVCVFEDIDESDVLPNHAKERAKYTSASDTGYVFCEPDVTSGRAESTKLTYVCERAKRARPFEHPQGQPHGPWIPRRGHHVDLKHL